MSYKYITNNNLYEKQNYMYSEYGGIKFINDYVYSRRNYLKANKPQNVNWGGTKVLLIRSEIF
jgi:hypothetical protein